MSSSLFFDSLVIKCWGGFVLVGLSPLLSYSSFFSSAHSQLSATNSLIVEDLKTFPFSCFLLLSLAHICSLLTRRTKHLTNLKNVASAQNICKIPSYMFTTSFLKDNTAKVLLKDRYKEVLVNVRSTGISSYAILHMWYEPFTLATCTI